VEHVGIDLGSRHSHIVVMSQEQEVLLRRKLETVGLESWLRGRPRSRVVMESCTQSRAAAAFATAASHEVVVVPSNVVRTLGVGARGIKTDDRDAEVLAMASVRIKHLNSAYLRSAQAQERVQLISARQLLVASRSSLSTSVKSWLRGRLVVLSGRASSPAFSEAVRRTALAHSDGLPLSIATLLDAFDQLCAQIEKLDAEIEKLASEDAACRRMQTMPGVGPVVSLALSSHMDTPERFENADKLASFLALVPGENTTGGKLRRTGTILAGDAYIKSLLVQAAWVMWRTRPHDPLVMWARHIEARRGRRIAIVALARKIAAILWAMWKHGKDYDPSRASVVREGPLAHAGVATMSRGTTNSPKPPTRVEAASTKAATTKAATTKAATTKAATTKATRTASGRDNRITRPQ
jgi:transposase